jgi:hypothetical protein
MPKDQRAGEKRESKKRSLGQSHALLVALYGEKRKEFVDFRHEKAAVYP